MTTLPRVLCLVTGFTIAASSAAAQPRDQSDKFDRLRREWTEMFERVSRARGLTLDGGRLVPEGEAVTIAYEEILDRVLASPELQAFFDPDDPAVQTVSRPSDREWIARLAASGLDGKGAKSTNAGATNPFAPRTAERSGFTDFLALALDARNVFAANQSAVSLNLNAVALVGLKSADVYSAPEVYRQHGTLRRIGGTVTFGGKAPEAAITGFSGFPSADTLLDVFAWDTKVRVIGDRDPRSARWHREMIGTLGGLTELAANIITLAPQGDLQTVQALLADRLGVALARVTHLVSHSMQVSVKASGQHLTTETGTSRYSVGALADKGFGDTDLTLNLFYTRTAQRRADPLDLAAAMESFPTADSVVVVPRTFRTDVWTAAVGVNSLVAKDAIAKGRAVELSLNGVVDIPATAATLPTSFNTIWRIAGAVIIPWGDAARIPVTVTYASDPNSLKKQKQVIGHIGIDYDFGALTKLFK
jgi:hypothetical protein